MSLSEKAAYLRGLYDGMELDAASSKEAKLFSAVIDVLQETVAHVTENEDSIAALADRVDEMDEDDGGEFQPVAVAFPKTKAFPADAEDETFPEEDDEVQTSFEVECPNCERVLTIGEEELSRGQIECPTCRQNFQIELSFEDDPSEGEEIPF